MKVFWVPLTVTRQTGKPPSWEDLYNITEVAVSRFPAFSYLISWQVLVGNSSDVGTLCKTKYFILNYLGQSVQVGSAGSFIYLNFIYTLETSDSISIFSVKIFPMFP